MAELTAGQTRPMSGSFYLWITVVMGGVVFVGFGISYFVPMMAGDLALPAVVHVHGFFYFAWMALLVWQAALIRLRKVPLHRNYGLLGIAIAIAIATALMIFGSIVTIIFTQRAIAAADPTVYGLMYISLIGVIAFGLLFYLAIKNIRDTEAHKRYILLATVAFLMAGLNRIYLALFDIGFESHASYMMKYATIDLFLAAIAVNDWRQLGRLHPATLVGAVVLLAPQIVHIPVVEAASFETLTHWLGALAG